MSKAIIIRLAGFIRHYSIIHTCVQSYYIIYFLRYIIIPLPVGICRWDRRGCGQRTVRDNLDRTSGHRQQSLACQTDYMCVCIRERVNVCVSECVCVNE